MLFQQAQDCKEAQEYLEMIDEDPIAQEYGCAGEVSQDWLRKHIKTCKKCEDATILARMP